MRIRRKAFDWSTALISVCMGSAAVVVYLRDGWDRFAGVFLGGGRIFLDILPKMAAGCLIGVFSTLLIPRALVWELPFFGTDFVLWRMAIAPAFPIVVGLLGRWVAKILVPQGFKP